MNSGLSVSWRQSKGLFKAQATLLIAMSVTAVLRSPDVLAQTAIPHTALACSNCTNTYSFISFARYVTITDAMMFGPSVPQPAPATGTILMEISSTIWQETAYVRVYATRSPNHGWSAFTETAVDPSGNTLITPPPNGGSGTTENSNEAIFTSIDATAFGTSRKSPTIFSADPNFCSSFIDADDGEVIAAISAWERSKGIPDIFEIGTVITIKFSDGTSAQYIRVANGGSYLWKWTGVAHNSQGQLINRDGSAKTSPFTSGGSGSGSVSAPQLGPAGDGTYGWGFGGLPGSTCSTTYSYYASDAEDYLLGVTWGPCG